MIELEGFLTFAAGHEQHVVYTFFYLLWFKDSFNPFYIRSSDPIVTYAVKIAVVLQECLEILCFSFMIDLKTFKPNRVLEDLLYLTLDQLYE
jgi:hypothetical protein